MYSVRLSGRQQTVGLPYRDLEQTGLINRLGQVLPVSPPCRKRRRRDGLNAHDVVGQSLSERSHDKQTTSKRKHHLRTQSARPAQQFEPFNGQKRRDSHSPTPPIGQPTQINSKIRQTTQPLEQMSALPFPKYIDTDRDILLTSRLSMVQGQNKKIPQKLSIVPSVDGKWYYCQVTMTYRSEKVLKDSSNIKRDEVTILQESAGGYSFVVFKAFLRTGEMFSFKSQRLKNDRFDLKLYVNDLIDSHVSSCCEYAHRNGDRVGGQHGLFWIQNIDGARRCRKCGGGSELPLNLEADGFGDGRSSKNSSSLVSSENRSDSAIQRQIKSKVPKAKSSSDAESIASEASNIFQSQKEQEHMSDSDKSSAASIASTVTHEEKTKIEAKPQPPIEDAPQSKQMTTETSKSKQQPPTIDSPVMSDSMAAQGTSSKATTAVAAKKIDEDKDVKATLSQTTNADDQGTHSQSLLSVLQQVSIKSELHMSKDERAIGNVENFLIVSFNDINEEEDTISFQHIVSFVRYFSDGDKLFTFLEECIHEKAIIVLPEADARSLVARIHGAKGVYSIYLLTDSKHKHSTWTKEYSRIAGIYQSVEQLCDHLSKVLPKVSKTLVPITTISPTEVNDSSFTYCQLLKETMLDNDDESDLKKDFIEFCHLHYANNTTEIGTIHDFEQEFKPDQVIRWYTQSLFLTKILDRALRTQEVDLFYKVRYIMQSLCTQLKGNAISETTTVYVSLNVTSDNVEKLKENTGGLLVFGGFLSAMLKRTQPLNVDKQQSVIFVIDLAPGCGANIEQLRHSDSNVDVLVNIDTVFRIQAVDEESNNAWNVHLKSINMENKQFQQLTNSLRAKIKTSVVILQLARLLLPTDHYSECNYIAELLFADGSLRGDHTLLASLAAVHHLLGNVDEEKGDSRTARAQFKKALRAFQAFLPPDHHLMSPIYNNIGSMYYKDDEYDKAIEFHRQALQCQLNASSPDPDSIATYSNNIGAVYFEQKKFSEALKHFLRGAEIMKRLSSSKYDLKLSVIYQKIASSYWRLSKAKESIEFYEKTLEIELVCLPPTSHQISVTYFNLSTAYARVGRIDEAVTTAEKSIEQLLKVFPLDHPEVKENQAQLEIVRQKQWLQQFLAN